MPQIDLNADLGEGYGPWTLTADQALMPYLSSASVACGFHAGDPNHMQRAFEAAKQHSVAIGAHPGFDDKAGFGRRRIALSPAEITTMLCYQIGAAQAVAALCDTRIDYVKAHGALANWGASDREVADAIMRAVRAVDPQLQVLVIANTELEASALAHQLPLAREAYIDRAYLQNGQLAPRDVNGAVLHDLDAQLSQLRELLRNHRVQSIDGHWVAMRPDSLCLHGDGAHAIQTAQAVNQLIADEGYDLARFASPRA